MLTSWAANVRKYAPQADEAAIAGIARYAAEENGPDAAWISLADAAERDHLRERFLRGRLGQIAPDGQLDGAIEVVGRRLQGEARPDRVTVYYLLAEHFGELDQFAPRSAGTAQAPKDAHREQHGSLHSAGSTALGAAGEAAAFFTGAPIAGAAEATIQLGDLVAETADASAGRLGGSLPEDRDARAAKGTGRSWWLVPGLLVVVLIVWLIFGRH